MRQQCPRWAAPTAVLTISYGLPWHLHPFNHVYLFPPVKKKKLTFAISNYHWKQVVWPRRGRPGGSATSMSCLRLSSLPPCVCRARLRWLLRRAFVQQHAAGLQPGGVLLHCFWSVLPSCHRYCELYPLLFLHRHISRWAEARGVSAAPFGEHSARADSRSRFKMYSLSCKASNFSQSRLVCLNVLCFLSVARNCFLSLWVDLMVSLLRCQGLGTDLDQCFQATGYQPFLVVSIMIYLVQ